MNIPTITTRRHWSAERVRYACIKNNLYTRGDNEAYGNILDYVSRSYPDTENLYLVAKDICEHSKGQTVSNVMFIIESEAVTTTFAIEGEED